MIDDKKAELIAIQFFAQSFSVVDIEECRLVEGIWFVKVSINHKEKHEILKIDSNTGRVLEIIYL